METALLRQHPLFRRVPEPLWAEVSHQARRLEVPQGGVVYTQGHFRRCLGVLIQGRVQVRGGAVLMSTLSAGDLFGAAALFGGQEDYPTTLTALTDCEAVLLPQEAVRQLLWQCPPFAEDYVTYLSGRVRFLGSRLSALAAGSAEGRLARYLLSAAGESGEVTASAATLCQRVGMSRATLYRAFAALEEQGAIARTGKTIRITDPDQLRACCAQQGKED